MSPTAQSVQPVGRVKPLIYQLSQVLPSQVSTAKAFNVLLVIPGQLAVFCKGCFPVARWPTVQGLYGELSSGKDF